MIATESPYDAGMAIPNEVLRSDHTGNGVTTSFPYGFKIFSNTEIVVYVDTVLKTLTTDYSVTSVGEESGGSVVFVVAPANGAAVALIPTIAFKQDTDLVNSTAFFQDRIETQLDKCVRQAQINKSGIQRTIRAPEAENVDLELPSVSERSTRVLAFDAFGVPVAQATDISQVPWLDWGLIDGDPDGSDDFGDLS